MNTPLKDVVAPASKRSPHTIERNRLEALARRQGLIAAPAKDSSPPVSVLLCGRLSGKSEALNKALGVVVRPLSPLQSPIPPQAPFKPPGPFVPGQKVVVPASMRAVAQRVVPPWRHEESSGIAEHQTEVAQHDEDDHPVDDMADDDPATHLTPLVVLSPPRARQGRVPPSTATASLMSGKRETRSSSEVKSPKKAVQEKEQAPSAAAAAASSMQATAEEARRKSSTASPTVQRGATTITSGVTAATESDTTVTEGESEEQDAKRLKTETGSAKKPAKTVAERSRDYRQRKKAVVAVAKGIVSTHQQLPVAQQQLPMPMPMQYNPMMTYG